MSDTSRSRRAVERLLQRMQDDPQLPDSLRRMTLQRLDSLPTAHFAVVDDSTVALYLRVIAATLRRLPEAACAAMLTNADAGTDLVSLVGYADSAIGDSILLAHERIVHAIARGTPRAIASPADAQAAIGRLLNSWAGADQQRFVRIAQNPPPSQVDACWAVGILYGSLSRLPPGELGPLFRAMSQR